MPVTKYMGNNICCKPLKKFQRRNKNISEKKNSQWLAVSLKNVTPCGTFLCMTTGGEADLTSI